MKPLFTVHAGEYLVGSYIQTHYPKWNVWLPAKDTGIDLLVTNAKNTKAVSLQVKFSKDFNATERRPFLQTQLKALGWWTHQEAKIRKSPADLWVFALPSFAEHDTSFIILPPGELLRRLRSIHAKGKKAILSYLWVTKTGRCWDARELPVADQKKVAFDCFSGKARDFTAFLNDWKAVERRLK
jgi:hypothetical protein